MAQACSRLAEREVTRPMRPRDDTGSSLGSAEERRCSWQGRRGRACRSGLLQRPPWHDHLGPGRPRDDRL